jgi:NitT/TauT family transport system permease protein
MSDRRPAGPLALFIPPLVTLAVLVGLWQAVTMLSGVKPYVLPSPWAVMQAALEHADTLAVSAWLTARCAVGGFLLSLGIGSIAGFAFAHSPFLRRGVYPFAVFLQTVPIVAIAPLIILWMGPGTKSVILVALVVGIFPIVANVTEGVSSIEQPLRDLFRVNRATRWQTICKLEIPHAVPFLLTGARTSAGLCVIGAIVGEFFTGDSTRHRGLGYLIPQHIQWMKTDQAFAAVFTATLLGIIMFSLVAAARRWVLWRWCQR